MSYDADKLQVQNWEKSDFEVKFELEILGRLSPKQ